MLPLYHDAVKHIIDCIQRMILANHDRSHPCMNLISVQTAGSEQLHRGSHFLRVFKVHVRDLCDTLGADVLVVHFFFQLP